MKKALLLKNHRKILVGIGGSLAAFYAFSSLADFAGTTNRPVIVIMKNQSLTSDEIVTDQKTVLNELSQVNATNIKTYHLLNSLAATVSENEIARLKANPAVDKVVPDVVIHRTRRATLDTSSTPSPAPSASLVPQIIPGTCGRDGKALLDPEALQTTNTNSDDPYALTARSLGLTGDGVKVAYIADGVDPQNVNFIRADGTTSAFIDYQDFSGDGVNAVTSGDEAFIDSNAIAGQGLHIYDISQFSAETFASPCNIRIEGMAPGAQLVGLKVFSQFNYSVESAVLQAIDYAVSVDHVDVLNESFGTNYFPDVTALDVTELFNDAAVKAGVTVVVSSGDAGKTSTIGGPSTDPLVISVGASTTFRFYAQTNMSGVRYFAPNGWLNDNISALSSGGFEENARTVDLVAPGDLGFASCDASGNFQGCLNFLSKPSPIEESGGTSLSSPLTAGASALVIEAYRRSHQGNSPTPALVKQILASTATDLGVPAVEQGAGLLNSYKAVLLAQTVNNGSVFSPLPNAFSRIIGGQPLLLSENQLNGVGAAGSSYNWPVTVTNTTDSGQFIHVDGRTFGSEENIQTGQMTLTDGVSLQFTNDTGSQDNYSSFTFSVPVNSDRLNASIAYPGSSANADTSIVKLVLIDPQGRYAANSLPQGLTNSGSVDVRKPIAGTWRGIIYANPASIGGTNGTIPWRVSTQRFVKFGSVKPSSFFLSAGKSRIVQVSATAPSSPGDSSGSIVVTSLTGGVDQYAGAESNSIPVTLRSLVDPVQGGTFNGVLTGGNGRAPGMGQVNYYQFYVDPGHMSIMANVSLTNDTGDCSISNLAKRTHFRLAA